MVLRKNIILLGEFFQKFKDNAKGVAAVEFTLIAPFMIALYIGSVELSQGITIDRKVSHASSALADLITQETAVDTAQLNDIMDATSAFIMPYNVANLDIVLVGVDIDGSGNATVSWGHGRGATPPANGSAFSVPADLLIPDTFLVTAEIAYDFSPVVGKYITGTRRITDSFFLSPRRSNDITFTP